MVGEATIEVVDNEAENRFEITVNGSRAGFLTYHRAPQDAWSLMHTEIGDVYGGQGLGTKLVVGSLDRLRQRGVNVLPYCPFVRAYLSRHPEQVDLVPPKRREDFGL